MRLSWSSSQLRDSKLEYAKTIAVYWQIQAGIVHTKILFAYKIKRYFVERVFIVIDLMWPIKSLNHILNGLMSKLTWRNTLDWPKKELQNDSTADSLPFTLLESVVKIWLWQSKYLADRLFQFSIVWILIMVKFVTPPLSEYFACDSNSVSFVLYSNVHFQ